jgi:type IV secretory pathway TrbD component
MEIPVIDIPGGPEARQQIEALTVAIRKQREEQALRDADRNLDEWYRYQAESGTPLPPLSAEARAIAVQMIAKGENCEDAARLALEESQRATHRPSAEVKKLAAQLTKQREEREKQTAQDALHAEVERMLEQDKLYTGLQILSGFLAVMGGVSVLAADALQAFGLFIAAAVSFAVMLARRDAVSKRVKAFRQAR